MQQGGCNACSWAMVLKNLNRVSIQTHPDFRYGDTRTLAADPFGVTLASTQDFGQHYNQELGRWECDWPSESHTPVYIYHEPILNEYGVTQYATYSFPYSTLAAGVDGIQTYIDVQQNEGARFTKPCPFDISVGTGESIPPEVMTVTAVVGDRLSVTRPHPTSHGANEGVYEGTEEAKALAVCDQLVTHPHSQGVIVMVDGHFLVFTETTLQLGGFSDLAALRASVAENYDSGPGLAYVEVEPDDISQVGLMSTLLYPATSYEQGFTVCDPLSPTPEQGADVTYANSYSFLCHKRLFEIQMIVIVGPERP